MTDQFFERPILNSPYDYPGRYWELDDDGQPTDRIVKARRPCDLTTPVPKPLGGTGRVAPTGRLNVRPLAVP